MLYLIDQKKSKSNRHRYFHMRITLASIRSNITINLFRMQTISLADLLLSYNFTSQGILESVLFNLIITDRGRFISLEDFDGQLECDSQGIPYWNVYLKTTALITSRCLAREISKKLFKTNNSIAPNININSLNGFERCNRKHSFSIPKSDFYPGHFSKIVLKFDELLSDEQIKEAIKKRPEKYRLLIETKAEITNT